MDFVFEFVAKNYESANLGADMFSFARFLISCSNEGGNTDLTEYLKPLAKFIQNKQPSQLKSFVTFEEAKWICHSLQKQFVKATKAQIENLDSVDFNLCLSHIDKLEVAVHFGSLASKMLE